MQKQEPKKHHFIPQSYLKRFCSEDDHLFILNKQYGKVNPQPRTTAQVCYLEHLHTLESFGKKNYSVEKILGTFEDKFSNFMDFIEGFDEKLLTELLQDENFVNTLKIMLGIQFWRNPKNTDYAKSLSGNLLDIFDSSNPLNIKILSMSRKDVKFIYKKRKNESFQKIIQFFLLPLITFPLNGKFPNGWKIVRSPSFVRKFVTSDNPICSDNYNISSGNFIGEFAFPLTDRLLLTNTDKTFEQIQKMQVNNAEKLVISSSKEILQELVSS